MCHADKEKEERETKEGKELWNQERISMFEEEENFKNFRSLHHEERKNKKRVHQKNKKTSRKSALQQKSHQQDEQLGCLFVRY